MKQISSTNQTSSGTSDPEEIEVEGNPELATIATQLQKTSSDAVDPEFVEELGNKLIEQLIEHQTKNK